MSARRLMPLVALWLGSFALDARAEPPRGDGLVDPWGAERVTSSWLAPEIIDPWASAASVRSSRVGELGTIELVDPWAGERLPGTARPLPRRWTQRP